MSQQFTFKICILGEGGVGKTTMLHRFIDNKFNYETKMTIGVEIFRKKISIGTDIECDLQIWDFGGQERFRFFQDSFVMGAKGALILFDLTRNMTIIDKLEEWVTMARKYDPSIPLILIGAKADLEQMIIVNDQTILEAKENYKFLDYLKVSAKTGQNVYEAFELMTIELLKNSGISVLKNCEKNVNSYSSSN